MASPLVLGCGVARDGVELVPACALPGSRPPRRRPPLRAAFGVSVGRPAGPFRALAFWSASIAGAGFEPATFGL